MSGVDVSQKRYQLGMNTYNTIKLSYIQMLIKGQVMEKWEKNIFWVMQKYVFDNMVNRFRLNDLDYNPKHKTQYHVYNLVADSNIYKLELVNKKSTTIANLLKAFTHQPIPSLDKFVGVLERKIKLKLGLIIE